MNKKGLKKMLAFLGIIDILSESNEYHYLASIGYKNSFSPRDTHRLNDIYHYLNKNFTQKINATGSISFGKYVAHRFLPFFLN